MSYPHEALMELHDRCDDLERSLKERDVHQDELYRRVQNKQDQIDTLEDRAYHQERDITMLKDVVAKQGDTIRRLRGFAHTHISGFVPVNFP